MKLFLICSLIITITIPIMAWDYFLFTQVWPPSWLNNLDESHYNFTNNYFTVHGLWPEDYNGSWPQYCKGKWPYSQFNVSELDPIITNLTKYWTDFKNPEKFWMHEYYKHLLCAENVYTDPYDLFYDGLQLRSNYDLYQALADSYIYPSLSRKYKVSDMERAIERVVGYDVIVSCRNNQLNEVHLCINKNLTLFDCPKSQYSSLCHDSKISYAYYKISANLTMENITDPAV